MKNLEDAELLFAISNGNEQAFTELYHRYFSRFHSFLKKFNSQGKDHSSDILQEAFLRVWLNRDRLGEIQNFEAWLFKVLSTESLTLLRKEAHQKTKVDRLKSLYDTNELSDIDQPRFMELYEIKEIVKDTLIKMPEKRREIYLLSREHGLTANEIAQQLNISPNTVYNTLTSALKEIRQSLADQNFQITLSILVLLKII